MRILVTGANGFVGSALIKHLLISGHVVVPVVRRQTGILNEKIIEDEKSWCDVLTGCNTVVHLAGVAHVLSNHKADILEAFTQTNVLLTLKLAHLAVGARVRRFVYVSSLKVNGESTSTGFNFSPDDISNPQDFYGKSKWEAEQGLMEISRLTGLEVVIIRPPLVYGPGVKGNFSQLIQLIKSGIPIPLGLVDNQRSLIALDNLVDFLALCADHEASVRATGQTFMVSDGKPISTVNLLRQIALAYRCPIRLLPVPIPLLKFLFNLFGMSEVGKRLLGSLTTDDSKAFKLLGWRPKVSIDSQLRKMANASFF